MGRVDRIMFLKVVMSLAFAALGAVLVLWLFPIHRDAEGNKTNTGARSGAAAGTAIVAGLLGWFLVYFSTKTVMSSKHDMTTTTVLPTLGSALEVTTAPDAPPTK